MMYLSLQSAQYAVPATRRCHQMGNYPWRRRRSLLGLGAISPTDAVNQIFPQAKIRSAAGHNQSVWDTMLAAVNAGQMVNVGGVPIYLPGSKDCAGSSSVASAAIVASTGTAGSVLLKIGAATANPIVIAAGAASAVASLVFSAIFGHHLQAIAKERSVLCAAVPAANDTIVAVDQAVQTGTFTPQQAITALTTMVQQFGAQVSAIQNGADPASSGQCNAACVMLSQLRAIVAYKVSKYQDLVAAQQAAAAAAQQQAQQAAANPVQAITTAASSVLAPVQSTITSVSTSTGIPTWAIYGAAALFVFSLLK